NQTCQLIKIRRLRIPSQQIHLSKNQRYTATQVKTPGLQQPAPQRQSFQGSFHHRRQIVSGASVGRFLVAPPNPVNRFFSPPHLFFQRHQRTGKTQKTQAKPTNRSKLKFALR
ncbi:MAG: hypothetical protein ACT6Q8_20695, partial [Niveispirillum sp.]|uniref:hypothetical protein n=1 Tax=Niveispirillum sp. TaxID=1917217 RepID=UPI0040359F2F